MLAVVGIWIFVVKHMEKREDYGNENKFRNVSDEYLSRYTEYSFDASKTEFEYKEQYEAVILRLIHTVEKGLSVELYQAGRGVANIEQLISVLVNYAKKYGETDEVYRTGLCACEKYFQMNSSDTISFESIKQYNSLPGTANEYAGIIKKKNEIKNKDFHEIVYNRSSIRHFSDVPVDEDLLKLAIDMAQHTPSACNRQGWVVRVISNPKLKKTVLDNQNGNKGFSAEIDKLILITYDLKTINHDRETYQAYIDGGMYAMTMLYALEYYHIASVPLSASLHHKQYETIRKELDIDDNEVFILFIGVGNFPKEYKVPMSHRREASVIYY